MNTDKQTARLALKEKFPDMFQCSIDIGIGWLPLLEKCCEELDKLKDIKAVTYKGDHVVITQVKEKFGMLTIYTQGGDWQTASKITGKYCKESMSVCEDCGKSGTHKERGGWISTLCKDCAKNRGR